MDTDKQALQGWGGHIGRPQDPTETPTTKEQLIRNWALSHRMQVPAKSGNLVWIDIYYASPGAAEAVGGRPFDSLVSMKDRAFFVQFVPNVNTVVERSFRPILCVPGLSVAHSWWVLPATIG